MERYLDPYEEALYAIFRFMFGLAFMFHGTQKLFGWPGDARAAELLSLRGLAGVIEVSGGALVALGLWAGWAALLASGTMAVAYFLRHAPDGFWPIINRGELAVLYCFAFLSIAARGSGRYSLERRFHGVVRNA